MELLTIPAVVAMVEALKMAGLSSKFAPIVSILLGLIMGMIFVPGTLIASAGVGILIGLSASGIYSGGKTLLTK